MLRTIASALTTKVGIGISAVALAAGGAVVVYNVGDSSPSASTHDSDTAKVVAAAGDAQDDYQAACESHVRDLRSKMGEALDRFASKHPDVASSLPHMSDSSPSSACTMNWKTFVHDVCTSAVKDRPEPSADVLNSLPEGLRPLVEDPCNAKWSDVDWGKAVEDFDPSAIMDSACKQVTDDKAPAQENGGAANSLTYGLSMDGLGFKRLCKSGFTLGALGDVLNEIDWKAILKGDMPPKDQIEKWRDSLHLPELSVPTTSG